MTTLLSSIRVPVHFNTSIHSSISCTLFRSHGFSTAFLDTWPVMLVTSYHSQTFLSCLLPFYILPISGNAIILGLDWFAQFWDYSISTNQCLVSSEDGCFLDVPDGNHSSHLNGLFLTKQFSWSYHFTVLNPTISQPHCACHSLLFFFVGKTMKTLFSMHSLDTFALSSFSHDALYKAIHSHGLFLHDSVVDCQNTWIHHLLNGLCAVMLGHKCSNCLPLVDSHVLKVTLFDTVINYAQLETTPIYEICAVCKSLSLDCLPHSCAFLIDFLTRILKNSYASLPSFSTMCCCISQVDVLQIVAAYDVSAASNSELILSHLVRHMLQAIFSKILHATHYVRHLFQVSHHCAH